ncbi:MAG: DUF2752 domain-containing protein [Actinomycetota bacterium]
MTPARRSLLRLEIPLAVLCTAYLALAFAVSITGIPRWIPPALLVRAGLPSPLSGMTRSFVALASGDVASAFAWHPLGPALFTMCTVLPAIAVASWVHGRRPAALARLLRTRSLWLGVAGAFALAWVRQISALD